MKYLKEHEAFTSRELKNPSLVVETLLDCIRTGDLASFQEVLASHLITVNKSDIAKVAGVGRRTLYDLTDPTKDFNPELSTISAIIQAIIAQDKDVAIKD